MMRTISTLAKWLCVAVAGCAAACSQTGGGAGEMAHPAGQVTLTAAQARIIGSDAKLEQTKTEEHVGWWERTNTYLQWTARDLKPGTYTVEALYALDPEFSGSTIATTVGTQTLTKKLEATKNWDDYHAVHLGEVKIEKAGDAMVLVKVTEKPKLFVMNLQQVILTPR